MTDTQPYWTSFPTAGPPPPSPASAPPEPSSDAAAGTALEPQIMSNPVGTDTVKPLPYWAGMPTVGPPPPATNAGAGTSNQPRPRVVGTDQFGNVMYDTPDANAQFREGVNRGAEKAAEGATFGTFPYISAAGHWLVDQPKRIFGQTVPTFQEDLTTAQNYTNETSKTEPAVSTVLEAGGAAIPTVATMGMINPAETAALKAAPAVIKPLVRPVVQGAANAGLAAASAAGHDVGSGNTEHLGSDTAHAAEIGGTIGALVPTVGKAVSSWAKGLFGIGAKDADVALGDLANKQYNIPVRVGQVSPAGAAAEKIPFSGAATSQDAVNTGWQRAVTRTFGEDAPEVNAQVLQNAKTRLGQGFDNIGTSGKYNIPFGKDPSLQGDLQTIFKDADNAVLEPWQIKKIQDQVKNIYDLGIKNNGMIPGSAYADLIKQNAGVGQLENSNNPILAQFGSRIRSALEDAMERSAAPDDVAALRLLRSQYKAYKTVAPLTLRPDTTAGTVSTGGIKPGDLLGAVRQQYDTAATAQPGDIPLLDLARIGQRFVKDPTAAAGSHGSGWFKWLGGGGLGIGAGVTIGEHLADKAVEWITQHASPAEIVAGGSALAGTAAAGKVAGTLARKPTPWLNSPYQPTTVQPYIAPPISANMGQLQPSTNPNTGLPEHSLKANQQAAHQQVARKLLDGTLADHSSTQAWIDQNKQSLRRAIGGQGLNRINQVAALLRRTQGTQPAPTVFAHLATDTPSPALQQAVVAAGVKAPEDLLGLMIQSPQLTAEMRRTVPANGLSAIGERRVIGAIKAAAPQRASTVLPSQMPSM